jgi:TolB-like protein
MKKAIIGIVICVFMAGCATPTIKATRKLSVQSVGTVAVLPFDGHRGDQFADSVTQELMLRGVQVVERSRVRSVLLEQGLSVAQIASGRVNYEKIGGLLGVDTVVVGSVSPIIVYVSGAPSGKVSTAALRFVAIKNGAILGTATYDANTELLAGSVLYPKAAEKLVQELFEVR